MMMQKSMAFFGVPDKRYGEEILASIVLKEGASVTVQEMTDYIKASMARHKVPRYIEFVDGFPMNAAGKVLKYKIREEAAKRLNLVGDGIDTAGNPGK
jgi:fatty-acyl-CoA synthase